MFPCPGALVRGRLGDLLWNASQNDRLIALYARPKQMQVRHGWNVEIEVFDLAHGGPVDVVLFLRPPAEDSLVVQGKVGENAVHVDEEMHHLFSLGGNLSIWGLL